MEKILIDQGNADYNPSMEKVDGQMLFIDLEGNYIFVDPEYMDVALTNLVKAHVNEEQMEEVKKLLSMEWSAFLIEDIGLEIKWNIPDTVNPFHSMDKGKQMRILCQVCYLLLERRDRDEAFNDGLMSLMLYEGLNDWDVEEIFDIAEVHLATIN